MSASIDGDILEGGWRALCAGMLIQSVQRMAAEGNLFRKDSYVTKGGGTNKEGVFQRKLATQWIEGGTGEITFEECCETLGVDPARAREKIREYCFRMRRKRISIESAKEWSLEQEEAWET